MRWRSAAGRVLRGHPGRVIVILSLAVACLHLGGSLVRSPRPRIVRGDAVHYYVYLRSLVFDRDLSFENDYRALYSLDFTVEPAPDGFEWPFHYTSTGLVRNYMAVGTPLVWLPMYAVVTGAVAAWNLAGGHYPLDGYGLVFQLVPALSGLLAGGLALWFAFLLCAEVASERDALAGSIGAFAGTSFLYYMLVAPSYSHAVSACVAAGFFLFWWRTRANQDLWRYAALGALGGLLALVRWQDAMALFVAVLDVFVQGRSRGTARRRVVFAAARLAAVGGAAAVVFSPQLLVWRTLYGEWLTIPQGADFMRWTAPAVASVLASPRRGLFSWTPVAAAGVVAIPWLWRRSRRLAVGLSGFLLASIYVNAAVIDWWAGEAFGARRFLSSFPVTAVGLTVLLSAPGRARRVTRLAAPLLVAANLLLLFHYELFMLGHRSLAAYPDNWSTLWLDRFLTPFRFLASIF